MNKIRFSSFSITFKLAIIWLAVLVVLCLLRPLISGSQPVYCKDAEGITHWQFGQQKARSPADCQKAIMPPIPFDHQTIRLTSRLTPPMTKDKSATDQYHILGTDALGRDVASGMLFGLRQALLIGFGSMAMAIILGYILGVLSAWYGDKKLRMTRLGLWVRSILGIVTLTLFFYFLSISRQPGLSPNALLWSIGVISILIILVFILVNIWEWKQPVSHFATSFPVDSIITRLIEIFQSVPALLILIGLTAIFKSHSVWSLAFIIFLIRWPIVCRFVRARAMTLREKAFLQHASQINMPIHRVLFREVFPHTLDILVPVFAFGVSTAILLEATLTFLGLGLPLEQVSWGGLIRDGRQHPEAWWLITFPGVALSLTLLSMIVIGEEIQRRFSGEDKMPRVL